MDALPLLLLLLAVFVAGRLVHLAVDPRARQNAGARPPAGPQPAAAGVAGIAGVVVAAPAQR